MTIEMYRLRSSPTSPFVRKVLMGAEVLGLSPRIILEPVEAGNPDDPLLLQNPLGKYPCLLREDGTPIYDSSVILEFLQMAIGSDVLLPQAGEERISMLVRSRLADGIIDAGALVIYEERYHPIEHQSARWLQYQRAKIIRALSVFEGELPCATVANVVSIGLACALGFLDRRKPVVWRDGRFPNLEHWLTTFASCQPAYGKTSPPPLQT